MMFAVVLFALIAAAAAAPHHFPHGPSAFHQEPHRHYGHYDPFSEDVFDTRQFWSELANEMRELDAMLATFSQKFPTAVSQAGIQGNEYKLTIPLNGFDENDIVVKAKEGFLMVQAVHKLEGGGERMYLDAKTMPTSVNVTGTWTFDQGILKIVFPLKPEAMTEAPATEFVTESNVRDREEMTSDENEDSEADIEMREDLDRRNMLATNEITDNRVEATTYSVDLKDEVEFVPVRY